MIRFQPTLNCRHETLGAVTASSRGTQVATAGSADTKGSWVDIGSTTSFAYHLLTATFGAATSAADMVFDLGINVGGNRWIIAPDLRLAALEAGRSGGACVSLPLYIPAGAQLSARAASSSATKNVELTLTGSSIGWGGQFGFSRMVALYTPSSSRGLDLDPTSTNTKTSWSELTSGVTLPVSGLLLAVGQGGESTRTGNSYLFDIGVGAAAAEAVLLANLQLHLDTSAEYPLPNYLGPFPAHIAASTRIVARCQAAAVSASDRKIDVAAWGFIA